MSNTYDDDFELYDYYEYATHRQAEEYDYFNSLTVDRYDYGQCSIQMCNWTKDITSEQVVSKFDSEVVLSKEDAIELRNALNKMYPLDDGQVTKINILYN